MSDSIRQRDARTSGIVGSVKGAVGVVEDELDSTDSVVAEACEVMAAPACVQEFKSGCRCYGRSRGNQVVCCVVICDKVQDTADKRAVSE